jgi:hypothetical protein
MKTNADAAIAKSIVDAKGDLIAGTAADTVARLAVGTNGQVLLADSAEATGLKWGTPAAGGATLLSTTTLSGASTTISGISGSYKTLYGVIYGCLNGTANGQMQIAINGGTTNQTATKFVATTSSNGVERNSYWNLNFFNVSSVAWITVDRTSANNAWYFQINNYAATNAYKTFQAYGYYNGEGDVWPMINAGAYSVNSAVTSLLFRNSGGSHTAGTVLLYGVN